ncbi:protein RETICULATA-RELATED 4, chloroplastic-like [Actinidia eriantha]|uniref:protein RETICULATA-RELATED 4, chloroplastic-like n=1 Tax=Actinidia eriantha TaxID=165200 RepID=UPI00258998EA|nr:protein RETICULATA-RELATED 4, chloroplastic-like [Actinidia eriantha]XP_057510543.1 protein RETICULATA-RELATED 4, chloroplastic-like [Actinidia eriantha]
MMTRLSPISRRYAVKNDNDDAPVTDIQKVTLAGTSNSFLPSRSHRNKCNGAKLFVVGTSASLVKTSWYQVLAGVTEQRILEPLLHQHKILQSAICFAI